MTLMPVSNMRADGSRASNVGASRWISQRSMSAKPSGSSSSGVAPHVPHVAEHLLADRHRDAVAGVAHGGAAGEAVGRLHADRPDAALAELLGDLGEHLDRRRPRRRCRTRRPCSARAARRAGTRRRSPGRRCRRPGRRSGGSVGAFSVMVICGSPVKASTSNSSRMRRAACSAPAAERLGAADDLHDLGRDRVLAGPVHDPAERLDQLLGVVGGRLHRPLAEGVLGRRGVEQGGVDAGLDVARQQRVEDRRRVGLELVVAAGPSGVAGVGRPSPPATVSAVSGTSGRSTTSWMPAEMKRV